ncbi:hypothetical protein KP509_25G024300 [Ceratopteris richardii]|uniref:Kinesin-like protein n=1 Tax=Ceratopteris richardii TaxID=49495 RepID=A0A8T2RQG7_CERRI|nr:hypothetical protein KP509_25G024300 [Ceratopteris richardii]KAH7298034.1 hypothetical protein KP509_25G024300 [Ceratopteris richardii]
MASAAWSSLSSVCSNANAGIHTIRSNSRIQGPSTELQSLLPEGEDAATSASADTCNPNAVHSPFLKFGAGQTSDKTPHINVQHELSSMSDSYQLSGLAAQQMKENIRVTVRFRPLSSKEVQKGDGVAWYADGETIVRSEINPSTAYAFDKVFGPATTTRGVYDVAAMNVVRGAMDGINGTVFAYGVTSSGKTYTMHGDPVSPGIIPLAVKEIFQIIRDTPKREYLLRVSYLEIYNEVINDLLNPTGRNLRIREDVQGPYVEGIKEEVVLSPVHALSLIAAGEELRHVGSTNYNLLSSRSHTVFTLKIESTPRTLDPYASMGERIISQLHLIDLAGSESSKTEATGERRREGSYINKSLLTLGTVIGKLSEGRASHVPYRDSKLTRLLQPSLCGYGRVSLICTLTPASSNMEETHNTLKFAQRAKRVTVQATFNQRIDERFLIRKYQRDILNLRQELDWLKRGMQVQSNMSSIHAENSSPSPQEVTKRDAILIARLEEEEKTNRALAERIQRLTKLILALSKSNSKSHNSCMLHMRRHSFGGVKGEAVNSIDATSSKNDWDYSMPKEYSTIQAKNDDLKLGSTSQMDYLNVTKPERVLSICSSSMNSSRDTGSDVGYSDSETYCSKQSCDFVMDSCTMHGEMLLKAVEIESLKQDRMHLQEENASLRTQTDKLLEEASYAKDLASAAAVELRNLAEEVRKLSLKNSDLESKLSFLQNEASTRRHYDMFRSESSTEENCDGDIYDIESWHLEPADLMREIYARRSRERCLQAALAEKEEIESKLLQKLEEGRRREANLENDLAGIYAQLDIIRKEKGSIERLTGNPSSSENGWILYENDGQEIESSLLNGNFKEDRFDVDKLEDNLKHQKKSIMKLQAIVSRLRRTGLEGPELFFLEEIQKMHMEALTNLFQAKVCLKGKHNSDDDYQQSDGEYY